jgi:hypothetical protein
MNKLAVVIINYETPELVEELVKQFSTMDQTLFDLDIIDNSTIHKTSHATIRNETNIGFDQALKKWLLSKKDAGYIGYWVVNTDITLDINQSYLQNFLNLLSNDSSIGLISTKIVCPKLYGIPQEIAPDGHVWKAGYVDLQSTVISAELVKKFDFSYVPYFHGGLDLEFNIFAAKHAMNILIDTRLSVKHTCGVSLERMPEGELENLRGNLDGLLLKGLGSKYPEFTTLQDIIVRKQQMFNTQLYDYETPKVNGKQRTIVIHVMPGPGHAWDPGHTEEGIGGSELAVINLSKELVKLGNKVYVFNYCKVP